METTPGVSDASLTKSAHENLQQALEETPPASTEESACPDEAEVSDQPLQQLTELPAPAPAPVPEPVQDQEPSLNQAVTPPPEEAPVDDQFNTLAEDAANDGLGRGSSYIPNSPDPVHDPFTALAEDAANDGLGRISSYIPNSPESEALPTSETINDWKVESLNYLLCGSPCDGRTRHCILDGMVRGIYNPTTTDTGESLKKADESTSVKDYVLTNDSDLTEAKLVPLQKLTESQLSSSVEDYDYTKTQDEIVVFYFEGKEISPQLLDEAARISKELPLLAITNGLDELTEVRKGLVERQVENFLFPKYAALTLVMFCTMHETDVAKAFYIAKKKMQKKRRDRDNQLRRLRKRQCGIHFLKALLIITVLSCLPFEDWLGWEKRYTPMVWKATELVDRWNDVNSLTLSEKAQDFSTIILPSDGDDHVDIKADIEESLQVPEPALEPEAEPEPEQKKEEESEWKSWFSSYWQSISLNTDVNEWLKEHVQAPLINAFKPLTNPEEVDPENATWYEHTIIDVSDTILDYYGRITGYSEFLLQTRIEERERRRLEKKAQLEAEMAQLAYEEYIFGTDEEADTEDEDEFEAEGWERWMSKGKRISRKLQNRFIRYFYESINKIKRGTIEVQESIRWITLSVIETWNRRVKMALLWFSPKATTEDAAEKQEIQEEVEEEEEVV